MLYLTIACANVYIYWANDKVLYRDSLWMFNFFLHRDLLLINLNFLQAAQFANRRIKIEHPMLNLGT